MTKMDLKVVSISGKETGVQAFNDDVFKTPVNEYAMYQSVRLIRANNRQGTHDSKGRAEVRGGGRKPFKQKGTGGARQGTSRAPHMPGGGRVFGPHPRDYGFKLNKKYKTMARKSALSQKMADQQIIVVEDFTFETPKTKKFVDILRALNIHDKKVLFITGKNDQMLYKSVRNMQYINMIEARNVSVYDLLDNQVILMQKSAAAVLNEGLKND
jgi:large subunit ribosomal protein L4